MATLAPHSAGGHSGASSQRWPQLASRPRAAVATGARVTGATLAFGWRSPTRRRSPRPFDSEPCAEREPHDHVEEVVHAEGEDHAAL